MFLLYTFQFFAFVVSALYLLKTELYYGDLIVNFLPQAVCLGVLIAFLFLYFDRYKMFFVSIVWFSGIAVYSHSPGGSAIFEPNFRLIAWNAQTGNQNLEPFKALVELESPDIVVIIEATDYVEEYFEENLSYAYPYRTREKEGGQFDILLASKTDPKEITARKIESFPPTAKAEFENLVIFGVHTTPPFTYQMFNKRNEHLEYLAENLDPEIFSILIGDFNVTPWSTFYRKLPLFKLCGQSYWARSWIPPILQGYDLPLLGLQIDHIFTNKNALARCNYTKMPGSDHHALSVALSLPR